LVFRSWFFVPEKNSRWFFPRCGNEYPHARETLVRLIGPRFNLFIFDFAGLGRSGAAPQLDGVANWFCRSLLAD
jgi:hypothetical protein